MVPAKYPFLQFPHLGRSASNLVGGQEKSAGTKTHSTVLRETDYLPALNYTALALAGISNSQEPHDGYV